MQTFLGFHSSEHVWLRAQEIIGVPTTALPSAKHIPTKSEIEKVRTQIQCLPANEPLHVLVADKSCIRTHLDATCHVWNGPAKGSFLNIGNGLHLSTPEACWRQIAGVRDAIGTILLGYQLCGTYVPFSPSDAPWVKRNPLTASRKLEAFLARTPQGRGCAIAREALPFVADNSASPRETAIALLLSLPRKYGGYGLPLPLLNQPIHLGKRGRPLTSKSYFVADLLWPDCKVCVEYDSEMFHRGVRSSVMDSEKRNALQAMGYTVVTLTNAQVKSVARFDETAKTIAFLLGKTLRIRRADWIQRHILLRRRILF